MVLSSGQFEVFDNDTSKSEMTSILIVRNVTIRNMGKYECVAKNPFGAAEANVRAYRESALLFEDVLGNSSVKVEGIKERMCYSCVVQSCRQLPRV